MWYPSGIGSINICTTTSTRSCSPIDGFRVTKHDYRRYTNLETFLREEWEAGFLRSWDANDMLTLLKTWQMGDVSTIRHGGDLGRCLSDIKAKGLIMPGRTDLYFAVGPRQSFLSRSPPRLSFQPEDSEIEISHLKNTARLVVIESNWGHMGKSFLSGVP